jgi:hypothetical protein
VTGASAQRSVQTISNRLAKADLKEKFAADDRTKLLSNEKALIKPDEEFVALREDRA